MRGYYTCANCRQAIDEVLKSNALMFANLGKNCSRTAYERAKIEERKNLRSVRRYDPEMIDRLVRETD